MFDIRSAVNEMKPYSWEESDEEIARKYGLQTQEITRFDMNTNPFVLSTLSATIKKISELRLNEYPSPSYEGLISALSKYAGVEKEHVIVGAGGDEIIQIISNAFIDNGNTAAVSTPTYSMFAVSAAICGGTVLEIPRNAADYSIDVNRLVEASEKARLLWLCNPNSPTGNSTPMDELRSLLDSAGCIVVVDEAYSEFSGKSVVPLLRNYDNLIVVRTLSKAFSLAGARVGCAVANEELVKQLNKVRPPCSISSVSVRLAEAALSEEGISEMRLNVAKIIQAKKELVTALTALGLKCFSSETNFVLVDFKNYDAAKVFEKLISRGLVTRDFSKKKLTPNCLRITVRKREENSTLISNLQEALS